MAVGLMPFSDVSYNITASSNVVNREEATANYRYTGSGGINQVYLSNGWQLIPNFLSIGARVGYAFGTVNDETFIDISERVYKNEEDTVGFPKQFNSSVFKRSSRYSDFLLEGGINMRKRFGKKMEVNLGFIYELASNMNTTRDETLEIVDDSPFPPTDSILTNVEGITFLPRTSIP